MALDLDGIKKNLPGFAKTLSGMLVDALGMFATMNLTLEEATPAVSIVIHQTATKSGFKLTLSLDKAGADDEDDDNEEETE